MTQEEKRNYRNEWARKNRCRVRQYEKNRAIRAVIKEIEEGRWVTKNKGREQPASES